MSPSAQSFAAVTSIKQKQWSPRCLWKPTFDKKEFTFTRQ